MMKLEVKEYVDEHFKNVNQFAVAIGIGYQAARKIYNGETSMIAFDTLEKMCEVFDCTPNDLLIIDKPVKKEIIIPNGSLFHAKIKDCGITLSSDTKAQIKAITDKFSNDIYSILENQIINKSDDK